MAIFQSQDRRFAEALSRLAYCNPFLPERFKHERAVLGSTYEHEETAVWSRRHEWGQERANVRRITAKAEAATERVREALAAGRSATQKELELYKDMALYVLYYRFIAPIGGTADVVHDITTGQSQCVEAWSEFSGAFNHFLRLPHTTLHNDDDPAHVFACLFQVRRAFWHIFKNIVGESMPIARLRAAVWQSIFTHDMRRYRRSLYNRMGDVTTLITGPSGTGKELVARAIGLSQFISFDAKRQSFVGDVRDMFLTLNLSALSPTLIESELFGHCKGAFTGAVTDRAGWLELAPSYGTVFLDEIGELDPAIQVKLLGVVQSRVFQRLGEAEERRFQGKIMAATNRDLAAEICAGRFREDFYYRLCSDQIHTVSLREQLADSPGDMSNLIGFIARRVAGDESPGLADEVEAWVAKQLADYEWPGNIRELEQCVRNVMIRGEYWPPDSSGGKPREETRKQWLVDAEAGRLSADAMLAHYCAWVYGQTGTFEATARLLGIDRRTVKSKVQQATSPGK
jgi:DNA-binding NtrC family response regulator